MQMFIWPCSQTMTYSLPDNHFRSLTSCTDNMTAAIKNEIQTLSVLLRGLCLKKSCTGVVNLRCRNVSTACVKHNIKFVPPVKAVSAFASASPFQRNVVCTGKSWAWIRWHCQWQDHLWHIYVNGKKWGEHKLSSTRTSKIPNPGNRQRNSAHTGRNG